MIDLFSAELEFLKGEFERDYISSIVKVLRSDQYIHALSDLLARIDEGEELELEDSAKLLGLPPAVLFLFLEMRTSDMRCAKFQQQQEAEILGGFNQFLKKCEATKH